MKGLCFCLSQAWQRPTLPRLKTKYHWRWSDGPRHVEPPDHYDRLSTLLDLFVPQSGKLMPLR